MRTLIVAPDYRQARLYAMEHEIPRAGLLFVDNVSRLRGWSPGTEIIWLNNGPGDGVLRMELARLADAGDIRIRYART